MFILRLNFNTVDVSRVLFNTVMYIDNVLMQYMKKKHCRKKYKICVSTHRHLPLYIFLIIKYIYTLYIKIHRVHVAAILDLLNTVTPAFKSSVKLRCDFSCLIKKKNLYTCTCILPFKLNIFIYRILLELFKFY